MTEFTSPAIWNKSHSKSCTIPGVQYRIGSNSTRAMVFKVRTLTGSQADLAAMACKVLLATRSNPPEQLQLEMQISTHLGQLYPQYFPVIFYTEPCDSIKIPKSICNQDIVHAAKLYHIQHSILPTVLSKPEIKRLEVEYRIAYDDKIYAPYWKTNTASIPAWLMFSELGRVDLRTWSQSKHTVQEWTAVINSVLDALNILKHEHITHNDLHHSNILIMFDGRTTLIDFGEAFNTYDPNRDLERFLQEFSYTPHLPKQIQTRIDYLKEFSGGKID